MSSIKNGNKDILVIAPTSAGKTLAFVAVAEELVKDSDDEVVLVLSHLGLLTEQTSAKFKKFSEMKTGILQADKVPDNDVKVIVSTVQSSSDFYKASHIASVMGKKVKAIIIDESHRRHSHSYDEVFKFFPDATVIDFTATPYLNRKLATGMYDDIAFQITLQELIDQKYIVPPILKQVPFDDNMPEKRCAIMLRTYMEYERGKGLICFLKSKYEAKMLSDAFNDSGVSACVVTADVTGAKRDDIFDRYNRGEIDALISVSVLEAGFDSARCEVVMMLGTQNPTSYIQRLGRALRPQDTLSVKPEHTKQDARIYVFGPTPIIESGEYEKHHNMTIKPKKKHECADSEELMDWLKDNDLSDTDEYHNIKEVVRVKKIAKKLNMTMIASMLENRSIDEQFLGRLCDSMKATPYGDKPSTIEQRKALIMALRDNRDIYIDDYSTLTQGEVKTLYKTVTGNDYVSNFTNKDHVLSEGLHKGKHVKDVNWAYKQKVLKTMPNSSVAKTIRAYHTSLKSSSQPK